VGRDDRTRSVRRLADVRLSLRLQRGIRSACAFVSALDLGGLSLGDLSGDMALVGVCSRDLCLRERGEAVFVEPASHRGTQVLRPRDASLGVRAHDKRLVGLDIDELPTVVLVDRLVNLDVLATGKADDTTGLVAVQNDLAVLLLKSDADALRDEVADDRT